MASKSRQTTGGVADENGEIVQQFAMTMHNLGLSRAGEVLVEMLASHRWQQWSQGGLVFRFLPGEFDYFLSQQDIQRSEVMAIPDLEAKAKLEEAMDERRTGEEGYRRPIAVARKELPELPGRPAMPYGYKRSEANELPELAEGQANHRPALGSNVRRYRNSGGIAPKARDERPRWERLGASARRLADDELLKLKLLIEQEHLRRGLGQR